MRFLAIVLVLFAVTQVAFCAPVSRALQVHSHVITRHLQPTPLRERGFGQKLKNTHTRLKTAIRNKFKSKAPPAEASSPPLSPITFDGPPPSRPSHFGAPPPIGSEPFRQITHPTIDGGASQHLSLTPQRNIGYSDDNYVLVVSSHWILWSQSLHGHCVP
ncbi:hypothetical protein K439DRAFT_1526980 [Ramaria rubella]|nr:hypothetical protein K439DRAFT_1526980 [Ramaria rubella]